MHCQLRVHEAIPVSLKVNPVTMINHLGSSKYEGGPRVMFASSSFIAVDDIDVTMIVVDPFTVDIVT